MARLIGPNKNIEVESKLGEGSQFKFQVYVNYNNSPFQSEIWESGCEERKSI